MWVADFRFQIGTLIVELGMLNLESKVESRKFKVGRREYASYPVIVLSNYLIIESSNTKYLKASSMKEGW